MKQIYHFDQIEPPSVSERRLLKEIEKRNLQKQTLILAVAGILLNISLLLFVFYLVSVQPLLAILLFLYFGISIIGGGIVTFVFLQKRRILIK